LHYKIVAYDSFGDASDKTNGCATHTAGTNAGLAVCGEATNLYRGHATNPKLCIVDMTPDSSSAFHTPSVPSRATGPFSIR
jgi:hypothetical protein